MTKSYVRANPASQTLKDVSPSSREDIRRMAGAAGLDLSEKLMKELCDSYPAFEAMVRRLPRARLRSAEPAHVAAVERLGSTPEAHSG